MKTIAKKPPDKTEEFLKRLEAINYCALVVSVWFGAGLLAFWILFGCGSAQRDRMVIALKGADLHWRLGALLLILLFYRTIRELLGRIEKGPGGTTFSAKIPTTPEDPPEEDILPKPGVKRL